MANNHQDESRRAMDHLREQERKQEWEREQQYRGAAGAAKLRADLAEHQRVTAEVNARIITPA